MTWVVYDNVAFNAEWVAGQSFEDFAAHEAHHGFTEKQLREVHKLCKEKVKKAVGK